MKTEKERQNTNRFLSDTGKLIELNPTAEQFIAICEILGLKADETLRLTLEFGDSSAVVWDHDCGIPLVLNDELVIPDHLKDDPKAVARLKKEFEAWTASQAQLKKLWEAQNPEGDVN